MDMHATEKAQGFDRTLAEDVISAFFTRKLGGPLVCFDSETPGVVAIEEPGSYDSNKFSWDELAADLVRETNVGVVCVANCTWQNETEEDGWSEDEATLIAFDIPALDDEYRNDPRNMIEPVYPHAAPTQQDFSNRDKAVGILKGRVEELRARMGYLEGSRKKEAEQELSETSNLLLNLRASDRRTIETIRDLNFALALKTWEEENKEREEDAVATPAP